MPRLTILLLLLTAVLCAQARATEYFAEKTGRPCAECHLNSGGDGPLTAVGEAYSRGGYVWPVKKATTPVNASPAKKLTKLLLGFLHLLAGVIWIGTIFYVHLVLKPRYALGGLPKTEMRIAWLSIAVLGATGIPLTLMRHPNLSVLLETRSGIFLSIKIGLYLFLVLSAAYVTLVLNAKLNARKSGWQENDGLEGRRSWVKVGELLYDFTESRRWTNGSHFGRHQAGQDLTDALKGAPHGPEKLDQFPSFSLADRSLTKENTAAKTLYIMAYVNLFAALGVLVAIALWRWG